MHELSIAEAVVEVVERNAHGRRVTRVEMQVGHLRQVVPSALEFAFELVSQGTVAEGAELVMQHIEAGGRCQACGADTPLPAFPLACRACGAPDVEVTRGEELLVDSLELEDNVMATSGEART